jgi:hypothetical protein
MSNRVITDEQFAAGGTIDGSRIQTALDDVEQFINNVPLSAIKQKYALNYMTFTYLGADAPAAGMPATIGGTRINPFLQHEDYPRVKGLKRSSLTQPYPADYENSADPYVFTVSTMFPKPVILDSVCLWINGIGVDNGGGSSGQEHGLPMKDGAGTTPLSERTPENITFTIAYKEALQSG